MDNGFSNPVKDSESLLLTGTFRDPSSGEQVYLKFIATDVIGEESLGAIRTVREEEPDAAIVVVYASRDPDQELRAFEAGADDCISLSFDFRYLSGRIRATATRILREHRPRARLQAVVPGFIETDPVTHEVEVGGRRLRLSALQFRLLSELMKERGKAVSHEHLERLLWGQTSASAHQSLKQLVRRLRHHLGNAGTFIVSMPGVGYMLR